MRLEHVVAVAQCLDAARVHYLVVGGLAVNAHGFVRYTNDLDLVVGLAPDNIRRALEALAALGYRPRIPVSAADFANAEIRESWIRDKGMIVLNLWCDQRRETGIDVFVREPFDFAAEWAQAPRYPIAEGVTVPVVTLPTLLRMKEAAGRNQDRIDIEELNMVERIRRENA